MGIKLMKSPGTPARHGILHRQQIRSSAQCSEQKGIMKKQSKDESESLCEESWCAGMLISHCHGLRDVAADSTK